MDELIAFAIKREAYFARAAAIGVSREQSESALQEARKRPGDSCETAWRLLIEGTQWTS